MPNLTRVTKFTILILSFFYLLTACGGGNSSNKLPQKDLTPPTISSKSPENRAYDVTIIQPITVIFNEAIDIVSENNVALFKYSSSDPNNFDEGIAVSEKVTVSVQVDNNKLSITPVSNYTNETRYKITLVGIKDKSNNPMADSTWEFATTTIPRGNIEPGLGSIVFRATDIIISFSEPMDPTSLGGFTLKKVGAAAGTTLTMSKEYNESDDTVRYSLPNTTPATYLDANSEYIAILSEAKDLNGNIAQPITSTFKTNSKTKNVVLSTKPTNVTAKAHNAKVDISWGAAPAIAGNVITYTVYAAIDGGTYLPVSTTPITGTAFSHTSIVNNKLYQYAVTANATGQESQKVFSVSAVRPLDILSSNNILIKAIEGDGFVNIKWDKIPLAISYNVYVKIGTGRYEKLNNNNFIINGTSFIHDNDTTGLKLASPAFKVINGNTYTYKISAVNANGDEGLQSASQSNSVTPLGLPPIPVFTLTKSGNVQNTLNWVEPDPILGITYTLKVSSGGSAFQTINVISLPFIHFGVSGLVNNSAYTYKLTATRNSSSISSDSDPVTLIPTKPQSPNLDLTFDVKKLIFKWTPITDVLYYRLLENINGSSGFSEIRSQITGTSIIVNLGITEHFVANAQYIVEACTNKNCISPITSNTFNRLNSLEKTTFLVNSKLAIDNNAFGAAIDISSDGNTIVVSETGNTINYNNTLLKNAGSVSIFERINNSWKQVISYTANIPLAGAAFGSVVSISGDGNTVAVGEIQIANLNTRTGGGEVTVFTKVNNTWQLVGETFQSDLVANNNQFGMSISLDSSGNLLAVGEPNRTVIGNTGKSLLGAGMVTVYKRAAKVWSKTGTQFISSRPLVNAGFGWSVSLSSNGKTLAVGEPRSNFTKSNQIDVLAAGNVTVFNNINNTWNIPGDIITANSPITNGKFGYMTSISSLGDTLAIGEFGRLCSDNTVNSNCGAAYVNTRVNNIWQSAAIQYLDPKPFKGAAYGSMLKISGDGKTLAVGYSMFNFLPLNYLYEKVEIYKLGINGWPKNSTTLKALLRETTQSTGYGNALGLSYDGNVLVIGEQGDNISYANGSTSAVGSFTLY